MSKFKVGDRVRLVSLKMMGADDYFYVPCGNNPIGSTGVISKASDTERHRNIFWYLVKWDNGRSDYYQGINLKKLELSMRNK